LSVAAFIARRREADSARRGERRDPSERTDSRGDDATGRDDSHGIRIDVTDPDDADGTPTETAAESDEADPGDDSPAPEVDVESELESIKRQIDGDEEEVSDGDTESGESDESDGTGVDGEDDETDGDSGGVSSDNDADSDDADGGEHTA
jgi:hypothetical protein